MANSGILGFQFDPTKVLQTDASLGKNWETCSSADSEPSTTRKNKTSVDTWFSRCVSTVVKSTTKDFLCYHELNLCKYFKINKLYVYLLSILQIFLI